MSTQRSTGRDLAQVAVFAGIIAVLGLIPAIAPFGNAVPITAQSLGIMLAGAILGARRGVLAVLVLLALVALGLPLLAGGRGGLGVFAGPSVGYLIGWPIAAWAIGAMTQAMGTPYRTAVGIGINVLGGVLLLNLLGVIGMVLRADLSVSAALVAAAPFVPGDLAKAAIAAVVAKGVHAAYPGLIRARRTAREDALV
ncbi:biotin transporter BioY [Janibacter sp. FSL W8-0316]|uniref:biotin transporter BioY n=1 Tax=Janibacter TaxID=53457 RepID=UPI0009F8330F|nr:biotin transporter BioY [Janibacter indicus]